MKSPSTPVMVPLVVPFTTTEAPITVSPVASLTTPLQAEFTCCAASTSFERGGVDTAYIIPLLKAEMISISPTDLKCLFIISLF